MRLNVLFLVLFVLALPGWASAESHSSFAKCSEPNSSLPIPDGPHGMFVLMFPGHPRTGEARQYLAHNPVVCGAGIFVLWSEVDRGPGASPRYDWSSVERDIEPWVAAGKMVSLIVWAVNDLPGYSATPQFVFDKVPSVTCPSFGRAPVFWNPEYMRAYQSFMAAVVDKFHNNRSVAYIRFGLGSGGETFPACMFALRKMGFSDSTWQKYQFEMLDYERSLNSPRQLAVGISAYGNPPNLEVAQAVAAHAVQDGIAIGNQSLSQRDVENDAAGQPCVGDWCGHFRQYKGKVPLILQTAQYNYQGQRSLAEALPFAMRLGTQVFELSLRHWLVAYDPSDPDYSAHHEEDQRTFEAAAKVLGGS